MEHWWAEMVYEVGHCPFKPRCFNSMEERDAWLNELPRFQYAHIPSDYEAVVERYGLGIVEEELRYAEGRA